MKILLVNDYGGPTGGAEIRMLTLREALRQRGHDARLFASSARVVSDVASQADYHCFGTTSRFRTLLQTVNPWAFFALRRVLAEFQPDVVHVRVFETQLSPLILPLLQKVPSLQHVVSYRPICPLGTKLLPEGTLCRSAAGTVCYRSGCLPLRDWLPLMIQRRLYMRWRHCFGVMITVSEAVRERLIGEGLEPRDVVANGVALRLPRPPLAAPPTIAFAGRLVWEKGTDVLLHAVAALRMRHPELRLLLAGDGPERPRVEKLILELNLTPAVQMLGHLPRAELENRFNAAWVQVVPSRWEEPFGNVALEAMMRGTAVVASRLGGLAEFVKHGETGLTVEPGSAPHLEEAIDRLLVDRALAERMGNSGRELAMTTFTEAVCAEKLVRIYERLCAQS